MFVTATTNDPTAAEISDAAIGIPSALVLMKQELDFYRERGRALSAVEGFPVRKGKAELGILVDLVFTAQGELLALVVECDSETFEVPAGDGLVVGPDALRPAV